MVGAQRGGAQIAGLFQERNLLAVEPQTLVRLSDGLQQCGFGAGIIGELGLEFFRRAIEQFGDGDRSAIEQRVWHCGRH